jgi:hypothetical protein
MSPEARIPALSDRGYDAEAGESESVRLLQPPPPPDSGTKKSCLSMLSTEVRHVQDVPFVFFCKHDDLHLLNKAVLYIQNNEQTNKIIIVHCNENTNPNLAEHVKLIDLLYPKVKTSLLIVNSQFNAATVEWLSQTINVPVNAMFISCPDKNFTMKLSQLRGMRIIASYE